MIKKIEDFLKKVKNADSLDVFGTYLDDCCHHSIHGIPIIGSHIEVFPKYIGMYDAPGDCFKNSSSTAIGFFLDDVKFKNKSQDIYHALIVKDTKSIKEFMNKLNPFPFVFSIEYSRTNAMYYVDQVQALRMSHLVSVAITLATDCNVIPIISSPNKEMIPFVFEGIERGSVLGINTKGMLQKQSNRDLLVALVKYAIDFWMAPALIIYTVSPKDENLDFFLKYARQRNVKVIIPETRYRLNHRKMNGGI